MKIAGTVKFYDGLRTFGYIVPDDGGPDIYVHGATVTHAGLLEVFAKGLRVEFTTVPDRKGIGRKAENLSRAPTPAAITSTARQFGG